MIVLPLVLAAAVGMAPPAENRLGRETSPYLLQHARDPVDWYPWGEEAFRRARAEKKLVFLSIGYSTCHWCHVMAEESFSSSEIGEVLNAHFIAIKVDREERPDVDAAYMTAARRMLDETGWPLNLLLTPDGKPFFAATYVPKERLRSLLDEVALRWREHPERILAPASMVFDSLAARAVPAERQPGEELLRAGFEQLAARYDPENGGFLPAPKVPAPHQLMFLLRYWHRSGDPHALGMAETTLRALRRGAIYDRIGFGFHRYATGAKWNEPHYEKMLCDQALLAIAYLEAHQATGEAEFAATAREIFTYVLRELRSPEGVFYSAQDADERYYTSRERHRLPRPARDTKILADWNGLMIAALARGAAVLEDPEYAAAARRAADRILSDLRRDGVRLLHTRAQPGFLDDYAFVVWGLLELYEATFRISDLETAIRLQEDALRLFCDEAGRCHVTAADAEPMVVRPREAGDGAIPSGNSVTAMNLVRIARITAKTEYADAAARILRVSADEASLAPSAHAHLLSALDFFLGPSHEIVLAGSDIRSLLRVVHSTFVPNRVLVHRPPGRSKITSIAPYTTAQRPRGGKPTAYVCTNHVCKLPTSNAAALRNLLRRRSNER